MDQVLHPEAKFQLKSSEIDTPAPPSACGNIAEISDLFTKISQGFLSYQLDKTYD
jgi:hypothetical protein